MNNERKVIYSTDADLLQSSFIAFNDNSALAISIDEESDTVYVHSFDLLEKSDLLDSWFKLDHINSSCGTDYKADDEIDFIQLTQDVCWFYGADNFDSMPDEMTIEEFENFISTL